MSLIDHETQPLEQWREGVMTLMRVSALPSITTPSRRCWK